MQFLQQLLFYLITRVKSSSFEGDLELRELKKKSTRAKSGEYMGWGSYQNFKIIKKDSLFDFMKRIHDEQLLYNERKQST